MLSTNTLLQRRYRILRLLGQGGMGAVYLAQDMEAGNRLVAIKENLIVNPAAARQFEFEAGVLSRLHHPNLPRVSAHFALGSSQYLVMDYIEGEDLGRLVARSGPLREARALYWIRQIMDAVAYLHSERIIHRDIKPANIRVTPQGRAVLVDFGIAKMQVTGQLTMVGAQGGTPGFAPPEQFGGGTGRRSDIFALGATLYYILTGRTPVEAALRSAGVPLPAPRQVNLSVSPNTERTVLRAMQLNAGARFRGVREMRQALDGQAMRMPETMWLAAAVGGVLILVVFLAGLGGSGRPPNGSVSSTPPPTFTGAPLVISTPAILSTDTPSPTSTPRPVPTVTPTETTAARLAPTVRTLSSTRSCYVGAVVDTPPTGIPWTPIQGRVADRNGKGVGATAVIVTPKAGGMTVTTQTGPDGVYTFHGLNGSLEWVVKLRDIESREALAVFPPEMGILAVVDFNEKACP